MKKILLIILILYGAFANAQITPPGYTTINQRYDWLAGLFKALGIPAGGNATFTTGQVHRAGAIYYDSTGVDSGLYVYTGIVWRQVGGNQNLQQVTDNGATTSNGITAPAFGHTSAKFQLAAVSSIGQLSLANAADFNITLKPVASSTGNILFLPDGQIGGIDTLATLADLIGYGGFFYPNQTSTGTTNHNANYNNMYVDSLGHLEWISRGGTPSVIGGFALDFSEITFNLQDPANSVTNTGFQLTSTAGMGTANISADDSIRLQHPNFVDISDSADYYMAVTHKISGALGKAYWTGGSGGSGVDSSAYNSMSAVDDTSWSMNRLDGTKDTIRISGGGPDNLIVDSIGDTGTDVIVVRNDSLLHRLITAGANVTIDTLSTGEIRIAATGGGGSQTPWTANVNADGFTLFGNDGSGETLTLGSTSHATKGTINLGTSRYDEVNNRLGIGGIPSDKLDVWGTASNMLVVGGELAAATRTNSTTKYGGNLSVPHYTLSEEPFLLVRGSSGSGSNIVVIGNGVASAANSATSVEMYTAANNTTTAGTRRFNLTNTETTFNDGLFNHNFIVSGDVDASTFVVDANGLTNGAVGIGTAAPTSKFHVAGSFAVPYTATATGITADATHHTIDVTATGQTITLPTAVGCTGRIYTIKLTASGSGTVATTSSQTIDGSTTYSLASQYKYVSVQSTNANWIIIANN